MLLRSFRARLAVGIVLWTAGLLAIAHMLSMLLILRVPMMRHVDHVPIMGAALLVIVLGVMQVRKGLAPFDELRRRLAALRDGRERNIGGSYPTEVQPLVNDLNALLAHRERVVARALAKAGDLAHGLKTPLALLALEVDQASKAGQHELAATIEQQVTRMRRQIDYHLAQARAAASGATPGARASVAAAAEALERAMQRIHADRGLAIAIAVPAEETFRGEREDLDEMLGNLLDNACKWGRTRVTLTSSQQDEVVTIDVDDDGPGLDRSMRERVLQRGVRADEASPGSGLGLAIVRDLAELYGGSIVLDDSPLGGLRARLTLPAA